MKMKFCFMCHTLYIFNILRNGYFVEIWRFRIPVDTQVKTLVNSNYNNYYYSSISMKMFNQVFGCFEHEVLPKAWRYLSGVKIYQLVNTNDCLTRNYYKDESTFLISLPLLNEGTSCIILRLSIMIIHVRVVGFCCFDGK